MIKAFLKIKHWQLFLAAFAIPMLIQMIFMNIMTTKMAEQMPEFSDGDVNPSLMFESIFEGMLNFSFVFSATMSVIIVVLFAWYWAVCVGLQSKVPEHAKMNVKKFKIFYFIGLVYSLFFVGLVAFLMYNLPNLIAGVVSVSGLGAIMSVVMLLHFFAVFCMFYCMYFAAKTIKTVELQRETTFSDFMGEFVLIWFFPIGVWLLQPKINEFAVKDFSDDEMDWLEDD